MLAQPEDKNQVRTDNAASTERKTQRLPYVAPAIRTVEGELGALLDTAVPPCDTVDTPT